MNRNEEFKALLSQTGDNLPEFDGIMRRAKRRNAGRGFAKAGGWLAGFFACFVLLVNFCSPVAYACSRVPGLRELARAVTFSRSLTDAVENEYVQPIELEQTENGITARVEYLIVDQKQVNVFFTLEGGGYEEFGAEADFSLADGGWISSCVSGINEFSKPAGELRGAYIELISDDVPESLIMELSVFETSGHGDIMDAPAEDAGSETVYVETGREPIAQFEFLLEFDPTFTETANIIEVGKSFVIDGQTIVVERVEIYPTHLRLELDDVPENTAWLEMLYFYIETDDGRVFETTKNGLLATGKEDSPMMASYRADSTYFYESEHLKLVITGAKWLYKDMEWVHVDLENCEAEKMPEGTELYSAERTENGWYVSVRAERHEENRAHQVFIGTYRDPEGNEGYCMSWSITDGGEEYTARVGYGEKDCFFEEFPIVDYDWNEIWLQPAYSHTWTAEEPVIVEIK